MFLGADTIQLIRPETRRWHFVNIPVGAERYDPARDCPEDACVVAAIERFRGVLSDRERPRREEAGGREVVADCRVFKVERVRRRSGHSGREHDYFHIDAATWVNVVAACLKCNLQKGNRTLEEARLRLIREPVHPQFLFSMHLLRHPHATSFLDSWRKYLVAVPTAL